MNLWLFCGLAVARAVDLLTTFLVTPDLSREANPFVRLLGWRLNLWVNIVLVLIAPNFPKFCICLIIGSFLSAAWNVWQSLHERPLH